MRKLRAGKAGMVDACTVRKEKREARDQRWADRGPGEDSILSGLTSHGDPVDETGDLICSRILALNLSI